MDFVTLDDFAFIFTQVQHNIGKWSMTYDAMQSGRIRAQIEERDYNDEEKTLLELMTERDNEFRNGNGVLKEEGKVRCNSIKKFLNMAFYFSAPKDSQDPGAKKMKRLPSQTGKPW
jgi:hypothetical protein